ncbi:MAG: ribosome small subunit-dependent GTPase A [Bacteroidota bacterium]
MKGIVSKSTGSWYIVIVNNNESYRCRVRGKLRIKGLKTTNPIAVGDEVLVSVENESQKLGIIEELLPRRNYIIRKAIKRASHAHIIAANIDLALLVVTEVHPKTSLGFIDRFLVTAESFRIPQALVFNKRDLLNEEHLYIEKQKIQIYKKLNVRCIETSALNRAGIGDLKNLLEGQTTLISGHSGVGKSSLINLISTDIDQKTNEISDFANKGVHTTTNAEMFRLNDHSFIIDTPGIKELGLIDMKRQEISDYFPEMREISHGCKFHNCLHLNEPGCTVKIALEEGQIAESRYHNYVSMLEGRDNRR